MARLTGDDGAPAITRLETGFGGGKTHSLIGLVHCAIKGRDIAGPVENLFPGVALPEPGTVDVVAIAGDTLDVHRSTGERLMPWTLWGEIAHQIGGDELVARVAGDAGSAAAPGEGFLRTVLGGRRVLILIDELAQYVTRFDAAHPGSGASNVSAFLMTLSSFVRMSSGMAVVVSLAGARDAFARQSESLAKDLSRITGEEVRPEDAVARAADTVAETESVVARDATNIVPVPQAELSRVLARRLFVEIDDVAAREAAQAYASLYERSSADLPAAARRADYAERMAATYPFHPTFIDFLN